jgi:hypothetical protein
MAYDEGVARRIRKVLANQGDVTEKKMFGGLALMLQGNMCCGIIGKKLMLRVGPEQYEEMLSRAHVRKMDFTGRPMKGFVYVEPAGFASETNLRDLVSTAVRYVRTLPSK